jgi:hypothetical protein
MAPGDRYQIEGTEEVIPNDGSDYVCYGSIVYNTVFGDQFTTSWKHSVVRSTVFDPRRSAMLQILKSDALPGGYSSEWEGQQDATPEAFPKKLRERLRWPKG